MRFMLRLFSMLPARLDWAHLKWAEKEINPQHKDVGYVQQRLKMLEEKFGVPHQT